METCDLCAEPLDGNGQVIANERITLAAAAQGVLNKTMGEFADALGMSREQMVKVWVKRHDNPENMPWDLCPTCALRIERLAYVAENAIKEKKRKKAWQIWKR